MQRSTNCSTGKALEAKTGVDQTIISRISTGEFSFESYQEDFWNHLQNSEATRADTIRFQDLFLDAVTYFRSLNVSHESELRRPMPPMAMEFLAELGLMDGEFRPTKKFLDWCSRRKPHIGTGRPEVEGTRHTSRELSSGLRPRNSAKDAIASLPDEQLGNRADLTGTENGTRGTAQNRIQLDDSFHEKPEKLQAEQSGNDSSDAVNEVADMQANARPAIRSQFRLELYLPERQSKRMQDFQGRLRFDVQSTEFVGRTDERGQLREFATDGPDAQPFSWGQIAGSAGQGKSRLALFFAQEVASYGWDAGFLSSENLLEFLHRFDEWQPVRPQLIVIDYVLGSEMQIGKLISKLAVKTEPHPIVRLLLIERQRWDRGGTSRRLQSSSGSIEYQLGQTRADWFEEMSDAALVQIDDFVGPIVELDRMSSKELVEIVEQYVEGKPEITIEEISKWLSRIDPNGRPLFALILAEVLSSHVNADVIDWSREDVLNYIVTRNQKKRWAKYFGSDLPDIDEDSPLIRAALVATLTKGITKRQLSELIGPSFSPEAHRKLLVIQDAPMGRSAVGPSEYVPPLQPDLLGGWMVLQALRGRVDMQRVMKDAWRVSSVDTAATLRRINEDFFRNPDALALFEIEPEGGNERVACAKAATKSLAAVWSLDWEYSEEQSKLLYTAANNDDQLANILIGLSEEYLTVSDDIAVPDPFLSNDHRVLLEFECETCIFRAATDQKRLVRLLLNFANYLMFQFPGSMSLRLSCRIFKSLSRISIDDTRFYLSLQLSGDTRSSSRSLANRIFQLSARRGHQFSMFHLARNLEKGEGFDKQDQEAANEWYKKAGDKGHLGAMFFLACSLQNEQGEPKLANQYYLEAAKSGHVASIYNLALNYQHGIGVDPPDPTRANELLREGADLGDAPCMFRLAINILRQVGVDETNYSDANRLLEAAVAKKHSGAAFVLAHNLERGLGYSGPDKQAAIAMRRKAAKLRNVATHAK